MKYNLDIALMVTASHNPWQDNGVKIYLRQTNTYSRKGKKKVACVPVCGKHLRELFFMQTENSHRSLSHSAGFSQECPAISVDSKEYVKWLWSFYQPRDYKVIWNANYGAAGGPLALSTMPDGHSLVNLSSADQERLMPDGPDPMSEENISRAKELKEAEVVFSFDGDGDRLQVLYKGRSLRPEYVAVVLALKLGLRKIVHDVHMSKKYVDFLKSRGVKCVQSKVGHSNVQHKMHATKADMGVEISGHYFWRECFGADDALLTAVKMLSALDDDMPEIEVYASEVKRIKTKDPVRIVKELRKHALKKGWKTSTLDGVKMFMDNGSILVRGSNTQPMLSVMVEGNTASDLVELEKTCSNLLSEFII